MCVGSIRDQIRKPPRQYGVIDVSSIKAYENAENGGEFLDNAPEDSTNQTKSYNEGGNDI